MDLMVMKIIRSCAGGARGMGGRMGRSYSPMHVPGVSRGCEASARRHAPVPGEQRARLGQRRGMPGGSGQMHASQPTRAFWITSSPRGPPLSDASDMSADGPTASSHVMWRRPGSSAVFPPAAKQSCRQLATQVMRRSPWDRHWVASRRCRSIGAPVARDIPTLRDIPHGRAV